MALRLCDEDTEFSLEIPADSVLSEAITFQMMRLPGVEDKKQFLARFSSQLAFALESSLDTDLQEPSEAQVKYGLAISRGLGVSLPSDALRYRGAMHEFISRHADLFKARTQRQANSNVPSSE